MNAQMIIDECDSKKFNPRQFRDEMIFAGIINDTIKEFKRQHGE